MVKATLWRFAFGRFARRATGGNRPAAPARRFARALDLRPATLESRIALSTATVGAGCGVVSDPIPETWAVEIAEPPIVRTWLANAEPSAETASDAEAVAAPDSVWTVPAWDALLDAAVEGVATEYRTAPTVRMILNVAETDAEATAVGRVDPAERLLASALAVGVAAGWAAKLGLDDREETWNDLARARLARFGLGAIDPRSVFGSRALRV